MFYNELPYGADDDFNEHVQWDSHFTKQSYELLTRIFEENNSIMTKAYVLTAMHPTQEEKGAILPSDDVTASEVTLKDDSGDVTVRKKHAPPIVKKATQRSGPGLRDYVVLVVIVLVLYAILKHL